MSLLNPRVHEKWRYEMKEQYYTFYIKFKDGDIWMKTYDKPKTFNQLIAYHKRPIEGMYDYIESIGGTAKRYESINALKEDIWY